MPDRARARVLVAGLGNVFRGDDAFGVHVVQRLGSLQVPPDIRVVDVGIKSLHLAYELADSDFDTVILVDVVSRGGAPGTLYVIEPDGVTSVLPDPHGVRPDHIIALVRELGGDVERVLLVGCEPNRLDDTMELSHNVAAAVDSAARLVLRLANEAVPGARASQPT